MSRKEFYDEVLIKLNRKYGKDELVASLNKKLSETQIELGKSNAYIEELKQELDDYISDKSKVSNIYKRFIKQEKKIKSYRITIGQLNEQIKGQKKTISELIYNTISKKHES